MKAKILINIHYLEIGGAETSLIGLLHSLDPHYFNVDLLINDSRGELMKHIPEWVNVVKIPEVYSMIERPIVEIIKKGYLKLAVSRFVAKYKYGKYVRKKQPKTGDAIFGYVGKYVSKVLPSLKGLGEYDVAISFLTPHNIVADKITAKKKIAWIHTDYTKVDVNPEIELSIWTTFDKIISISPDVTASFLSVFPSLEDKIILIENFLPQDLILKKAGDFLPKDMPKEKGVVNLLTIGRYCEAKRMDEIPLIAKVIQRSGISCRWYIIGYGCPRELKKIKEAIEKHKVEDIVILLGKQKNPYPYIKACDIYVQPSRYEGKSITVGEAQLLCKPVVITDYPTAPSQVNNEIDGFIGPYETEPFTNYLVKIINDKELLSKVINSLSTTAFSQQANLQKFLSVLNN